MTSKLFALILCVSVAFADERSGLPLPASRNVTLTLTEYDRLVDLARKSAKLRELPPLPYALKRAELKLRVENTAVMGTVQLEGEVFSRSVTNVPLRLTTSPSTCTAPITPAVSTSSLGSAR